jgi:endonuclease-3 related protein
VDIAALYDHLLDRLGPQGWWPIRHADGPQAVSSRCRAERGYHPGDYTLPRTSRQCFEVCTGAILTQNTAWRNVEKALDSLAAETRLDPAAMLVLTPAQLGQLVRPAGYFNQKARKLRLFSEYFLSLAGRVPAREELLALWGIGPETADSILLYAFHQPEFVVDAYTKRVLSHHGMVAPDSSYQQVKDYCRHRLPADLVVYQEFHALIVAYAKDLFHR